MECVTCEKEFTPRKQRPGLKGQCFDCGRLEERNVRRHVGLQGAGTTGKGSNIEIFFNPDPAMQRRVAAMNKQGFHPGGPSMPFGSVSSPLSGVGSDDVSDQKDAEAHRTRNK